MEVAVVGVGLIGGSMAAALRVNGHRVVGFDTHAEYLDAARHLGLIDRTARSLQDVLRDADTVILAAPVLRIVEMLPIVDQHSRPDALIVDVGSVKDPVVSAMEALKHSGRAIGGHPIAGTERSGPRSADAGIFKDRVFALCPSTRTTTETRERAEGLVREIGAIPKIIDAGHHDRVVARTSHLPQLLSTVLALILEPDDLQLAGPGLRDMTRLASSEPNMWSEIVITNRAHIAESMREYGRALEELMNAVAQGDAGPFSDAMERAAAAVASLRTGEPA